MSCVIVIADVTGESGHVRARCDRVVSLTPGGAVVVNPLALPAADDIAPTSPHPAAGDTDVRDALMGVIRDVSTTVQAARAVTARVLVTALRGEQMELVFAAERMLAGWSWSHESPCPRGLSGRGWASTASAMTRAIFERAVPEQQTETAAGFTPPSPHLDVDQKEC